MTKELTNAKVEEVRDALVMEAMRRKMTRWDAMNFVAGYANWDIDLFDAMRCVNYAWVMDLLKD